MDFNLFGERQNAVENPKTGGIAPGWLTTSYLQIILSLERWNHSDIMIVITNACYLAYFYKAFFYGFFLFKMYLPCL